jgi:hypothetical protein
MGEEGRRFRGSGNRPGNAGRVAAIRVRRKRKCPRQHADAGCSSKPLPRRSVPGRNDLAGADEARQLFDLGGSEAGIVDVVSAGAVGTVIGRKRRAIHIFGPRA